MPATAGYGVTTNQVSGHIIPMAIGNIPNMDGHGFRIMTGDGRPSIMEDGSSILITDGYGSRDMIGHPLGLPGARTEAIMDGLL